MTQSATDMAALVGTRGLLTVREGFAVAVEVVDARTAYGNVNVRVRPVAGTGEAWVALDRVKPAPDAAAAEPRR